MPAPTVPPKVNVNSGGKGGTVVLITGTLFIGYLYFTRRISNVFKAIQMPPSALIMMPTTTVPTTGPAPVTSWPRSFTLTFPPQYKMRPVEIVAADPISCRYLVYRATLEATGSTTLAEMYVQSYCR